MSGDHNQSESLTQGIVSVDEKSRTELPSSVIGSLLQVTEQSDRFLLHARCAPRGLCQHGLSGGGGLGWGGGAGGGRCTRGVGSLSAAATASSAASVAAEQAFRRDMSHDGIVDAAWAPVRARREAQGGISP